MQLRSLPDQFLVRNNKFICSMRVLKNGYKNSLALKLATRKACEACKSRYQGSWTRAFGFLHWHKKTEAQIQLTSDESDAGLASGSVSHVIMKSKLWQPTWQSWRSQNYGNRRLA